MITTSYKLIEKLNVLDVIDVMFKKLEQRT